jgi:thiaminase
MKLNFHILSDHERLQDASKTMLKLLPFTKMLINNPINKDIIGKMEKTEFIQLMITGNLSPLDYSYFEEKDTAYFKQVSNIYASAALNMNYGFSNFYTIQGKKFDELYKNSLQKLHLVDTKSVKMGKAFPEYIAFLTKVKIYYPEYLSIAMLPCSVSWKEVVGRTIDQVNRKNNVYYKEWFLENRPTPYNPSSTERFVDVNYTQLEHKEKALIIYCQALMRELNNFLEMRGEELISLKEIDKKCGMLFYK